MKRIVKVPPRFESMKPLAEQIAREGMPQGADIIYDERNRLFRIYHGGEPFIVKAFRRPNFINSVAYATVRKSKARRSFENALRLSALGINTPAPAAYMEVRRGGRLAESYYICRDVAAPQIRFWDRRPDAASLADALAGEMLRLHRDGVWHKDFSPGNVLVEDVSPGHYRLYHIDLNRMQFGVTDRKKLMSMFGRLHDDEAPIADLAARYAAQSQAADPAAIVAEATAAYRRFWQARARKQRLKHIFRKN